MIRVVKKEAVIAAAAVVFTAAPVWVKAQSTLPPLPDAAAAPPMDRLSPEEVQRATQRREREQVLAQLRELYARREFQEMLRLIQETERTFPNDHRIRSYGYLAQKGIDDAQAGLDAPIVSPDSPALQGAGLGAPPAGTNSAPGAVPAASMPSLSTALDGAPVGSSSPPPALPGASATAPGEGLSGLPDLPPPVAGGAVVPGAEPPTAEPVRGNAPPSLTGMGAASAEAAEDTAPVSRTRLILIGLAVLSGAIGLAALFWRRKKNAPASAPGAARPGRTGSVAQARHMAGVAIPPPVPAGVPPQLTSRYNTQRDAMTEVDAEYEEEVARGIADSIGSRGVPGPAVTMPAFDMLIPDRPDGVTAYGDNLPTVNDNFPTLNENLPTMVDEEGEGGDFPAFQLEPRSGEAQPVDSSPAPGSSAAPSGTVSFEDLGIVLFDTPKNEPAPAVRPAAVPPFLAPGQKEEKDPFANFNFGGVDDAPKPEKVPEASPDKAVSHGSGSSAPRSEIASRKPAPPAADEPIRLDSLSLSGDAGETVASSPAAPARSPSQEQIDDALSATVDLSDVLSGLMPGNSGSSKEDAPAGGAPAVRTSTPFDETLAVPSPENQGAFRNSHDDETISLETLGLSRGSAPPAAFLSAQTPSDLDETRIDGEDTVYLSATAGGEPPAHPDDALAATVGLESETVIGGGNGGSEQKEPAQESSYYASSPKPDGSLDERSERMFREQCARAEKAVAEANWKQAVHYLSIAAAIRPDDPEIMQRLRHAREEKRRQEANV